MTFAGYTVNEFCIVGTNLLTVKNSVLCSQTKVVCGHACMGGCMLGQSVACMSGLFFFFLNKSKDFIKQQKLHRTYHFGYVGLYNKEGLFPNPCWAQYQPIWLAHGPPYFHSAESSSQKPLRFPLPISHNER
jgi:hypothetical protein